MSVSVVLATFNGSLYIRTQLNSILSQSLSVDEIVVCDDCSTDDTVHIVANEYCNSLVKLIVQPENVGVVQTFANGLAFCKGEYIFLSDQDDIWMKDKVEIMMHRMNALVADFGSNQPLLVVHDALVVDGKGNEINSSLWQYGGYHPSCSTLASTAIWNVFTGCMMLFNRAMVELLLPIPPIRIYHDQWIGMVAHNFGKVSTIEMPLIKFVRHGENTTTVEKNRKLHGRIYAFLSQIWDRRFLSNELHAIGAFIQRYKLYSDDQYLLLVRIYSLKNYPSIVKKILLGYYKYFFRTIFFNKV